MLSAIFQIKTFPILLRSAVSVIRSHVISSRRTDDAVSLAVSYEDAPWREDRGRAEAIGHRGRSVPREEGPLGPQYAHCARRRQQRHARK
jgi:hypothetical protein